MDSSSAPAAGGTLERHRNLNQLWRSRRLGNKAFRHLMKLIGVISTVKPAVVEDPAFLERSVLVDGVPLSTSPNDLQKCFQGFEVMASVVVRDEDTGHRVGLVVFSEDTNIARAVIRAPPHFGYSFRAGYTRIHILDALDDTARRQPTAELLRSLIPPEYLRTDASRDFHLRCVFLRGPGCSGANDLCSIGKEVLLAVGRATAVIKEEACDAAEVAQFVETELGLRDQLEAVIVHRFPGSIFLVLGSQEDAQMLLQEPKEKWARAFGRPVVCHLLKTMATQLPPAPLQLDLGLDHWMSRRAREILRDSFTNELDTINDHDLRGLTRRLIGLAALSQPHALRQHSYFPDRAVLLTGIHLGTSVSDLGTALARYGSLDEVVHVSHRGLALVIFTSWTGATRLLREPAATRLPLGFGHCRPVPDAGFSGSYVDYVLTDLLIYQSRMPPFL